MQTKKYGKKWALYSTKRDPVYNIEWQRSQLAEMLNERAWQQEVSRRLDEEMAGYMAELLKESACV